MNLIEFLNVILLISATALYIALIYFVYQIVKSMHSISADIQGMSYKLNTLIQSTFVLSEKLTHIADEAESQLQISKSIVGDIRDRADKILNIETKIRGRIEDTAIPLLRHLRALRKGIDSFWRSLRVSRRNNLVE
jgi:predicted Holliday junction resolvase-like endonuclease